VEKRYLNEGVIVSQVADTFVTVAEQKFIVYPSYGITDRQKKRRHLGIRIERLQVKDTEAVRILLHLIVVEDV
jgi:ribosomal protein S17